MDGPKRHLLETTETDLTAWLAEEGLPKYRAGQIRRWLFQQPVDTFDVLCPIGAADDPINLATMWGYSILLPGGAAGSFYLDGASQLSMVTGSELQVQGAFYHAYTDPAKLGTDSAILHFNGSGIQFLEAGGEDLVRTVSVAYGEEETLSLRQGFDRQD